MDKMAYLQEISAKPSKSPLLSSEGFFSKKVLIPLAAVAVFAIIIIIVGMATGGTPKSLESTLRLNNRTSNLIATLNTYNKNLKSSELRSMGSSLLSVLQSTQTPLADSVQNDFGKINKSTEEDLAAEETEYITNVNTTLENARLNGTLDRVYAREIAYQIAMLRALQQECAESTTNDALKTSLTTSMVSLNNLYTQFTNFSSNTN